MTELLMLSSSSCDTCKRMKEMLQTTHSKVDILDVDEKGGQERLRTLKEQGLELTSDEVPQFYFKFSNNGISFAPTDAKMFHDLLQREAKGGRGSTAI